MTKHDELINHSKNIIESAQKQVFLLTKAALKNLAIFTAKHLPWGLFLIKNFKATLLK